MAVVLAAAILPLASVYGYGHIYLPSKGLFNRTFRMPAIVAEAFVVDVQDSSASQQRQEFFDAWRRERALGLHRQLKTVEGDPLHLWLVTSGGVLTLVTDYTRDPYSNRSIVTQHPVTVSLHEGRVADPLRAWFPKPGELYLRLTFSDGSDAYF